MKAGPPWLRARIGLANRQRGVAFGFSAVLGLCALFASAPGWTADEPPQPNRAVWVPLLPAAVASHLASAVAFALRATGDATAATRWWSDCADLAARADQLALRLACLGHAGQSALNSGKLGQAIALQELRRGLAAGHDPDEEADAATQLGALARRGGHMADAELAYRAAIGVAHAHGNALLEAQALSGLSLVFKNRGDYYEALESETSALSLRLPLGARGRLQVSYASLSALYEQMEDLSRARDYQARARAAASSSSDPIDLPVAQTAMAGLLNDSGVEYVATARELALAALIGSARVGNRPGMLDARFHIGRADLLLGRAAQAREELLPLIAEATALGQRSSIAHVRFRLAETEAALGNRENAIRAADESLALYVAVDNPHRQVKVHALLSTLYAQAGDTLQALQHANARLELREHLLGAAAMRRVGSIFDANRAQRDADRIQLLEQDQQIADARHQRDSYARRINALIAISLALALLVLAVRYRASRLANCYLAERERSSEAERTRLAQLNTHLYTSATTDPLTGLANRSFGLDRLRQRLTLAGADDRLVIGLMDVDDFKRVNDTYGHLAGDAVLRRVAADLRRELADALVVARIGGEEFLIVLDGPGSDPAEAFERVRAAIAQTPPEQAGATVSIGWCLHLGRNGELDILLAAADAAMYRAKALGRDRVEGNAEPVTLAGSL
ncbi:MAG: GGDEF domain-containing protein [Tahibacter sp.]